MQVDLTKGQYSLYVFGYHTFHRPEGASFEMRIVREFDVFCPSVTKSANSRNSSGLETV